MRKKIIGIIVFVVLLIPLFISSSSAASVYKVTLNIDFPGNLIFSKYDVDIYLNDLEMERLPHGKNYSGDFFAEEGQATIYFYNHEDKSVNGSINLSISGNTTVSCTINCYNNKVDITNVIINVDEPVIAEPALTKEKTDSEDSEPQTIEILSEEAEPTPEPQPISFSDIDLQAMSDDELAEALNAIKAEQRARIKTKVILDKTSIILLAGKSEKVAADVIDLPEGEKAPKLEWTTSDKSIVTCANGTIKAVKGGDAVVTCSGTLLDGTYIYEECAVHVNIPVAGIASDVRSINLGGGETYTPVFTFKPEDASITELEFESSKPEVASVNAQGVIEGTGTGTAVITAKATDGSGKSVAINVKVIDNRIPKEIARKVLLVGICNDSSLDIFNSNGDFDRRKFHGYDEVFSIISIDEEGLWEARDGGNTWHVSNFIIQVKGYSGYQKYSFDISFDGKNYKLENGWRIGAAQKKYLDGKNPSKSGESDLSNLDFYTYFIVSPKQIGE